MFVVKGCQLGRCWFEVALGHEFVLLTPINSIQLSARLLIIIWYDQFPPNRCCVVLWWTGVVTRSPGLLVQVIVVYWFVWLTFYFD